jgi:hypothetical protein
LLKLFYGEAGKLKPQLLKRSSPNQNLNMGFYTFLCTLFFKNDLIILAIDTGARGWPRMQEKVKLKVEY